MLKLVLKILILIPWFGLKSRWKLLQIKRYFGYLFLGYLLQMTDYYVNLIIDSKFVLKLGSI